MDHQLEKMAQYGGVAAIALLDLILLLMLFIILRFIWLVIAD